MPEQPTITHATLGANRHTMDGTDVYAFAVLLYFGDGPAMLGNPLALPLDDPPPAGQARYDVVMYEPDLTPPFTVLTGQPGPAVALRDRPRLPTASKGSADLFVVDVYTPDDAGPGEGILALYPADDVRLGLGESMGSALATWAPTVGTIEAGTPDAPDPEPDPPDEPDELPEPNTATPSGGELCDVGRLIEAIDNAGATGVELEVIVHNTDGEVIGVIVNAGWGHVFRTSEGSNRLVRAVDIGQGDVEDLAHAELVHLVDRGLGR